MAKKSKTQRAKASAKRAERREQQATAASQSAEDATKTAAAEEPKSKNPLKRIARSDASDKAESKAPAKTQSKASSKAAKKDTKSSKTNFFKEVRAELKRVTWPTRQDVLRWSGVVVVALVFFSVFVFVLDNWVVTPLLLAISSLGA